MRSTACRPDKLLDLGDDRDAIRLLTFERLLPFMLRNGLTPPLLDGLSNGFAG